MIPARYGRRLSPRARAVAREWIRHSYQAHFSGSPKPGVSRIRHVAEGAIATAGIRYLDRSYQRIIDRMLQHTGVPLLSASEFRPGAVLLATGSLGPGGSERQTVTTLLGMVAAGYADLSLLCLYLNSRPSNFYRHLLDGTPVRCAELRTAEDLSRIGSASRPSERAVLDRLSEIVGPLPPELRNIERFALELIDRRPEVLHTWLDDVNVTAGLAAAIVGVPRIVLSTRSSAPPNFLLFQPYMRAGYQALERLGNVGLLNNSTAGARSYERWLGLSGGRFNVLPNGFDFDRFPDGMTRERARREHRARHEIDDSRLVLGAVMRFDEEKRPLLWFETAVQVAQRVPQAVFLMIGDGPLRGAVRDRVKRMGLASRFFLPGNDEDSIAAMAAMDVFLLTSRLEGLPNVLIEAQAMGTSVVTTDAGGARETLLPGETGYAVEPHTPGRLADAVVKIMEDADFRAAVRTRAPAFIRETFAVERMVQATVTAYYGRRDSATIVRPPQTPEGGHAGYSRERADDEPERRFEFGKNWKRFIEKSFSEERVDISKQRLLDFMRLPELTGMTFLDIGCGSGLHSLAALRAGAARVIGFDYDRRSVEATRYVQHRAGNPKTWTVMQGSVLDDTFMQSLPPADVVYSWGVLHHTGDVWRAIRNAAGLIKEGGLFYLALYSADVHKDPTPEFWLDVKRRYLAASTLGKRQMELWYIWRFMMCRTLGNLPGVLRRLAEYKRDRGMDLLTDIRDWLGGWPMEFVHDADVTRFATQELGLVLENIATGEANSEFLFRKPSSQQRGSP